ncbi:electron transport complex protein RnfG [Halospina denitrificans]|uniref:Ion-translocating oxidoreductase complex subunit G n=1 Tax=Halospina denitrificans TaxID=332522 RepID=A0A4R7JYE0_9GAMM|nr:electron transport complex subunit RsxG [Halospina denitrificans]TDT43086.1 electron transport complex protein RnfG [Halospina denitrificans]
MNALARAMLNNAIGLGLFAAITAGAIGVTQVLTQERIEEQESEARYKALREVIPEDNYTNTLGTNTIELPDNEELGTEAGDEAFLALKDDRVTGVILPVTAPDGYSGDIDLILGITPEGKLTGVRVTQHAETPGLGDAIETSKSDWILDFKGHSLDNPPPDEWHVAPDGGRFDALSGATITSRAVVRAVFRGLVFFEDNQDKFLNETAPKAE